MNMENIDKWIAIAGQVLVGLLTVATIITGITRSPTDDSILAKISHVLRRLGLVTYSDEAGTFSFPGAGEKKA